MGKRKFLLVGLLLISTQVMAVNGFKRYRFTCDEERFNAINFHYIQGAQLLEGSLVRDRTFAVSSDGGLTMCRGDSKFGNEENTKCVGPGSILDRKWSSPVKLERGIHYSSALVLGVCKSILIEGFKEPV